LRHFEWPWGQYNHEVLDIWHLRDTASVTLANITRLLESTQLKTIRLGDYHPFTVFHDADATQNFISTLQRKKSSLEELPRLAPGHFRGDEDYKIATFAIITKSLTQNRPLNLAFR
jgi:hypothetical protein